MRHSHRQAFALALPQLWAHVALPTEGDTRGGCLTRRTAMSCSVDHGNSLARTGSRSPGHEASTGEGRRPRSFPYVVAVIEMPPRAFCLSVTRTLSVGSSSASATSSRILTASASQKCPSFR